MKLNADKYNVINKSETFIYEGTSEKRCPIPLSNTAVLGKFRPETEVLESVSSVYSKRGKGDQILDIKE